MHTRRVTRTTTTTLHSSYFKMIRLFECELDTAAIMTVDEDTQLQHPITLYDRFQIKQPLEVTREASENVHQYHIICASSDQLDFFAPTTLVDEDYRWDPVVLFFTRNNVLSHQSRVSFIVHTYLLVDKPHHTLPVPIRMPFIKLAGDQADVCLDKSILFVSKLTRSTRGANGLDVHIQDMQNPLTIYGTGILCLNLWISDTRGDWTGSSHWVILRSRYASQGLLLNWRMLTYNIVQICVLNNNLYPLIIQPPFLQFVVPRDNMALMQTLHPSSAHRKEKKF